MNETAFQCGECERSAVAVVSVEDTTRYLCRSHYRAAVQEYGPQIDEDRLLPTGVEL